MITITGWGTTITGRMPTLAELSTVRAQEQSADALKGLAKACLDKEALATLLKRKPAAGLKIGALVLEACGAIGQLTVLEEDELEGELAEAFVAAQSKGFEDLSAVRANVLGKTFEFILRGCREREVDDYMRRETAENAAALVEKICVHPAKLNLRDSAPGLYLTLSHYALSRAGLLDEATLGEA